LVDLPEPTAIARLDPVPLMIGECRHHRDAVTAGGKLFGDLGHDNGV
jgi:hypothetical protein